MEIQQLCIIGNGFDIYHGINSRYSDFRSHIEKIDYELYENVKKYLCLDGDWSDLEMALGWLDTDTLIDEASDFLVSYAAEDWSDAYDHDYQYEIEQVVRSLSQKLKTRFTEWVRSLKIPGKNDVSDNLLLIKPNSFFLTFNYTSTLSNIYEVPPEKIFHIHGEAIVNPDALVLGHAWSPSERKSLNDVENPEDFDTRVYEGNKIIDRYFISTFKPSATIIKQNQSFFDSLYNVQEIYIWGHSLSEVDLEYFKKIVAGVPLNLVSWKVSYYGQDEVKSHIKTFKSLGVNSNKIEFYDLSEFRR